MFDTLDERPGIQSRADTENLGAPSSPRTLRLRWDSQPPSLSASRARILRQHFFRRFFDNDTLTVDGETESAVIRALSFVAVPSLMFAFWLLPAYPGRHLWDIEADRYFFVLYSFVVMGAVATFEWEMLFPDRADFLILLTLPLKSRELFTAKAHALLTFLGMFLLATNLFALILFPAVSTRAHGSYFHAVCAHLAAVSLAGIFGALSILAIEGLVLTLLPSRWFRAISTAVQTLSITTLVLLFLLYPLVSNHLQPLMEGRTTFAQWTPPLWFLGLYEQLMQGPSAPAAAASLAHLGLYATAAAAALAVLTYPLAWSRQQKRALEGASQPRVQRRSPITALLHRTLLRQPQQRAIFHFVSQTIARNPRYQVYLALYAGAGLALALCTIIGLRESHTHTFTLTLSSNGLHAILPLLLFWMVVGLRASFAFPVDMRARWIFPISLRLAHGASEFPFPGPAAKSAKLWVQLCCLTLTIAIWSLLLALHWSWLSLLIQAICGFGLSFLLADIFFLGRTQIPFTRPRLPGRTSLPIVFTLYAALFPAAVLLTVNLELGTERQLSWLLWIALATPACHLLFRAIDHLARTGIIGSFPEDETDEGPQLLNLSQ